MLRIATNNALARATLAASDTVAGFPASNLGVDVKSLVHRASGTSVTYTVTLASAELIGVVAVIGNFSPTATIRVRLSSGLDTGTILACPAPAVLLPGFTAAQAASAYAFGGGAMARAWFTPTLATSITIDIVDTGNLQGYLEASRLFAGNWWSPAYNADTGATLTFASLDSQVRSDGGDLYTNIGPRMRRLSLNLSNLPSTDRASLAALLRATYLSAPLLVSVFPGDTDTALERDYTVYGKFSALSVLTWGTANTLGLPLDIEEM